MRRGPHTTASASGRRRTCCSITAARFSMAVATSLRRWLDPPSPRAPPGAEQRTRCGAGYQAASPGRQVYGRTKEGGAEGRCAAENVTGVPPRRRPAPARAPAILAPSRQIGVRAAASLVARVRCNARPATLHPGGDRARTRASPRAIRKSSTGRSLQTTKSWLGYRSNSLQVISLSLQSQSCSKSLVFSEMLNLLPTCGPRTADCRPDYRLD